MGRGQEFHKEIIFLDSQRTALKGEECLKDFSDLSFPIHH
jgi:hypothetical protein